MGNHRSIFDGCPGTIFRYNSMKTYDPLIHLFLLTLSWAGIGKHSAWLVDFD
jgi:hypothetical protein